MKKFKIAAIFLAVVICILALTSCKDKNGVPATNYAPMYYYTFPEVYTPTATSTTTKTCRSAAT